MIKTLLTVQNGRYKNARRKKCLIIEDKLLIALEYLRGCRTYFQLGVSYGLSESACYRACRWVEDSLIRSDKFSIPGKKALLKSDVKYELILSCFYLAKRHLFSD